MQNDFLKWMEDENIQDKKESVKSKNSEKSEVKKDEK